MSIELNAGGLYTDANPFSAPPGAQVQADDCVIDRAGLYQPRRGFQDIGLPALGDDVNTFVWYQGVLIFQHGTNSLSYWNGTAKVDYPGTYAPPTGATMRFAIANKNLYFTTSAGVYRLDAYNGTPVLAGGLKATTFTVAQTGTSGFQLANTQVAYRYVVGFKDANDNYIYGSPSQRTVQSGFANPKAIASAGMTRAGSTVTVTSTGHGFVVNDVVYLASTDPNFPSGNKVVATVADANHFTYTESGAATSSTSAASTYYASRNVALTVALPVGTTTSHFIQVFRTAQSPDATVDPGDEMRQVYEKILTNLEVAAGSFTFTDFAPDEVRGGPLYTNPSEGGILLENDPPPLAQDLVSYHGMLLGCNTMPYHVLILTMINFSEIHGFIRIYPKSDPTTPICGMAPSSGTESLIGPGYSYRTQWGSGVTSSQSTALTSQSLVRVINAAAGGRLRAQYISGPDDPPGRILIEATSPSDTGFFITAADADAGGADSTLRFDFHPALVPSVMISSLNRSGSTVTVTTTGTFATSILGLAVGQQIFLNGGTNPNFPTGPKIITSIIDSQHFTYTEAGAAGSGGFISYYATLAPTDSCASTAKAAPNGISVSQPDMPDAFPPEQNLNVGTSSAIIYRAVKLNNSVFVFTDEGLFRLSGDQPSTLHETVFDPTIILIAPNSVAAVGGYLFAWTNQGIVPISESGVGRPISDDKINSDLLALLASARTAATTYSFGVGYESDHKYILWTVSSPTDTSATQAYVYSLTRRAWTRWTKPAHFGAVDPSTDLLHISRGTTISKERKARNYTDQADEAIPTTVASSSGLTVNLFSSVGAAPGDVLWQSPLKWARITEVPNNSSVKVASTIAWTPGSASIFKAITMNVRYVPFSGQDPGLFKRFSEFITVFHGADNLSSYDVAFSTDLSTAEEFVTVSPPADFGGSGPVRTYVATEKQRGNYLKVGIRHANAYELPIVAGFRLKAEGLDGKGVR